MVRVLLASAVLGILFGVLSVNAVCNVGERQASRPPKKNKKKRAQGTHKHSWTDISPYARVFTAFRVQQTRVSEFCVKMFSHKHISR